MNKFHINSNGDVAECKARKRSCRFGEDSHFENESQALKESEKRMADSNEPVKTLKKVKRNSTVKKQKNTGAKSSAASLELDEKFPEPHSREIINAKNQFDYSRNSVRLTRDISSADFHKTAKEISRRFKNNPGKNSQVKVQDQHGWGLGVPSIRYNSDTGHFSLTHTRAGSRDTLFKSSSAQEVLYFAYKRYAYNDDEYQPIDAFTD